MLQLTQGSCLICPYTSLCLLSSSLSVRESRGWELMFTTPPLERVPHRIALNVRSVAGASGGPTLAVVIGKWDMRVVLGGGTLIGGWSVELGEEHDIIGY